MPWSYAPVAWPEEIASYKGLIQWSTIILAIMAFVQSIFSLSKSIRIEEELRCRRHLTGYWELFFNFFTQPVVELLGETLFFFAIWYLFQIKTFVILWMMNMLLHALIFSLKKLAVFHALDMRGGSAVIL